MRDNIFPTSCTFTGFSGCPVYLVQEKQSVADVMAITWKDEPDKGVFAGSLVLMDVQEHATPELPLNAEVYMTNEDNQTKVVILEDIEFTEEVAYEKAIPFIARRVVVEEYHQIPLEEEL